MSPSFRLFRSSSLPTATTAIRSCQSTAGEAPSPRARRTSHTAPDTQRLSRSESPVTVHVPFNSLHHPPASATEIGRIRHARSRRHLQLTPTYCLHPGGRISTQAQNTHTRQKPSSSSARSLVPPRRVRHSTPPPVALSVECVSRVLLVRQPDNVFNCRRAAQRSRRNSPSVSVLAQQQGPAVLPAASILLVATSSASQWHLTPDSYATLSGRVRLVNNDAARCQPSSIDQQLPSRQHVYGRASNSSTSSHIVPSAQQHWHTRCRSLYFQFYTLCQRICQGESRRRTIPTHICGSGTEEGIPLAKGSASSEPTHSYASSSVASPQSLGHSCRPATNGLRLASRRQHRHQSPRHH